MHAGHLAGPLNLTVEKVAEEYLKLKWDPPFSLNITNVHSNILLYTVHERFADVSANITSEEYLVVEPCREEYSITAWNQVGEGNSSSVYYEYTPTGIHSACTFVRIYTT